MRREIVLNVLSIFTETDHESLLAQSVYRHDDHRYRGDSARARGDLTALFFGRPSRSPAPSGASCIGSFATTQNFGDSYAVHLHIVQLANTTSIALSQAA
ncbi:hypothetical protein ECAE60S_01603 [Eoetvoesiella caeni]